jgi:hypothetical protein
MDVFRRSKAWVRNGKRLLNLRREIREELPKLKLGRFAKKRPVGSPLVTGKR